MTTVFSDTELAVLGTLDRAGIEHFVTDERALLAHFVAQGEASPSQITNNPAKVRITVGKEVLAELLDQQNLTLIEEPRRLPLLRAPGGGEASGVYAVFGNSVNTMEGHNTGIFQTLNFSK